MTKIFKKVTGIILISAMVMGISTTAFAEERIIDSTDYIVTYSEDPITDVSDLIALALEQATPNAISSVKSSSNSKILTATQVLEERSFVNGNLEKDISITQIIPRKEQLNASDITSPVSEYTSDEVTGHSISSTFYYTVKLNQADLGSYTTYRFDKLITKIVKTNSTDITYSRGSQMYKVKKGIEKWQNIYYNNSSTVGSQQAFTLTSSHSSFYDGNGDMLGASEDGVFGQVEMDFSNGEYITFLFNAWQ